MATFFRSALGRSSVLGVFAITVIAFLVWIFQIAGMRVPLISEDQYSLSFRIENAGNLVPLGDVRLAGVKVGKVREVRTENGKATVEMDIDPSVAPMHEGLSAQVGQKTLVGEAYVGLTDGTGAELPSGSVIPSSNVKPAVQLADVLRSLDAETRESLRSLFRSLGEGTRGTKGAVSNAMAGLGNLGREGYTALDGLAAQSKDLTALARQTSTVLRALNISEGQIGTLVQDARRLTAATSGQNENLRASIRKLPGVMTSAQAATGDLERLATSLSPVAADLKEAAPHLTTALKQLPATADDLRGLLPSLDSALGRAPATLDRVPQFASDVSALVPQLCETMSHLNPVLDFVRPYGGDLAAFFSNFGAILKYTDEADLHFIRLQPTINPQQVKGIPLKLPTVLTYKNAYPAPGQSANPGPGGDFPRLYPQPSCR